MSTLKTDNTYYNFELRNDATTAPLNSFNIIQARKDVNFNDVLLQNPNEFYCSISRFTISGKSLPLMVCPILGGTSQSNPNLTPWTVSLVYQNNIFTSPVLFEPTTNLPVPVPPSQNNGVQKIDPYYNIYYYSTLSYIITNALINSYNNLKTAFPSAPIGAAPVVNFVENGRGIFEFVCDRRMAPQVTPAPNNVRLFFNPLLNLLLSNTAGTVNIGGLLGDLNLDFELAIYEQPFGSNEYFVNGNQTTPRTLVFYQEFNNVAYINAVKSIVFISNSLGTNKEFISSKSDINELNGLSVIADFEISNSEDAGTVRNLIQYSTTGTGNYRLIDIKTVSPVNKLDLSVYWTDNLGNLYPILLYPNTYMTVKFVFTRKTVYSGNK
jgi:hypothetical protein